MKTIVFIRSSELYNDSRATKTIKSLEKTGHKIIVLCSAASPQAQEKCSGIFKGKNIELRFSMDKSGYRKNFGFLKRNFVRFKRFLTIYFDQGFAKWAVRQLKEIQKQNSIDFIHACDIDCGAAARKFVRNKNIRFVYDSYDYFADTVTYFPVLSGLMKRKETKIFKSANTVILCIEERINQIKPARPKNVVYIHNVPNFDSANIGVSTSKENNPIKLVFIGGLNTDRLLEEIANEIQKHEDIELIVGGFGVNSEKLASISMNNGKVKWIGPQTYADVLRIESACDILFACYDPRIKNNRYSAPNKFYHAMAMSKPIIVCRNTGIDKIVERENTGVVVNYSAKEFFEAVEKLRDPRTRLEMGERANKLYQKNYTYDIMEDRLLEIYKL